MSRLGQIFVLEEREGHFSGLAQCPLSRPISNHSLLLPDDGGIRGGSIPFRIGNIRLAVKGFKESHKGWWVGYNFRGSNSLILASKFKTLESDLKAWSKEDF